MVIVFIMPPSEIKRVVSTTSDFQRTGADFSQVSDNNHQNFTLYEQPTAEDGLDLPLRLRDVGAKKEHFPDFAKIVMKRYGHHLANNPRDLTEQEIFKIYESAW
jgi:alcohol dehydrogenase class IV